MQPAIDGKTPAAIQSRPLPIPAITRDPGDPGDPGDLVLVQFGQGFIAGAMNVLFAPLTQD